MAKDHPNDPAQSLTVAQIVRATYRKHWFMLAAGLFALILGQAGAIFLPKIIGIAVDGIGHWGVELGKGQADDIFRRMTLDVIGEDAQSLVPNCLIALACLGVIVSLLQYFKRLFLTGLSRHYEYEIHGAFLGHLQKLERGFFTRMRSGDIVSRATSDIEATRMMIGPALMYISETLALLPLALIAMYSVSPALTLWAMVPLGTVLLSTLYFSPRQRRHSQAVQERQADLSARAQENFSGVRVVKAFNREEFECAAFDGISTQLLGAQLRLARSRQLYQAILTTLPGAGLLILMYFGAREIGMQDAGRLTIGGLLEFFFYYTLLTWPMMAIGWVTLLVSRGRVSARRINAIFAERVSKSLTASAGDNATNIKGDIEFRGVGFGFEPGKPILHNISFRVQAGSVLGITGPVGAGKSTIANLLLRLEEPASGEILIDGKPVGDYEANSLRAAIGYVPQETFLFSETVAQNIAFGAPGAQREQVAEAAELAGVSGEIANLPKGYDTMLGERGVNLSGGQKQRLAIARALAGRPRIVVVDDCLSAVDTKTEEHILRSLKEQLAGCTVIMISQRVTSIAHAGEIIVLDRGRIVERGTHETLRTADGLYATLAQRQEVSAKVE